MPIIKLIKNNQNPYLFLDKGFLKTKRYEKAYIIA